MMAMMPNSPRSSFRSASAKTSWAISPHQLLCSRDESPRQKRRRDEQRHGVGVISRPGREPRQCDGGQRHVRRVFVDALLFVARRLLRFHPRDLCRGLRDRREVFVDPRVELLLFEVARDEEDGVVGTIERRVKRLHVVDGGGVEVFDAADAGTLYGCTSNELLTSE
jgi:hypothetical protein